MQEYRVNVSDLRVGVFIRLDLPWFKHPFLFANFKIRSQDQIETLRQLGLSTVLCVPEKSDRLPEKSSTDSVSDDSRDTPDTLSQTSSNEALWKIKRERMQRLKAQRKRLECCEKQFEESLERVKHVMGNLGLASEAIVHEADALVGDMVSSLLSDTDVIVHLMSTKPGNEDIFYHSLNAVVLGLLLGRACGLEAEALQNLGLGMMFHDIGKQRIPKKVLRKQSPLTPAELRLIQLHPTYGAEIISSRVDGFPQSALDIIERHHETIDGLGYPSGLTGDRLPLLVRLATIANVFDNHCNKLDPATSLTPAQALSFMFRKQAEKLDKGLITLFIRCLGVYPPGTIVRLSNDSVGVVVGANTRNSLRPSVLLYDRDIPKNEALIFDMEDDPELTVVESIHPSKLSPDVYEYLSPRTRISYFTEPAGDSTRPLR